MTTKRKDRASQAKNPRDVTVVELSQLIKDMEEKFGVSAAAAGRFAAAGRAAAIAATRSEILHKSPPFLGGEGGLDGALRETMLDFLVAESLGLSRAAVALRRILPVNIFLADGSQAHVVLPALHEFLTAFGLDIVHAEKPVFSSYFQQFWARTFNKETADDLRKKIDKIEKALETQHIDKPKSEVDLNQANAVAALLNAIGKESKSVALQIGNLVLLTVVDENGDKHARALTLTQQQLELLHQNQELLLQPEVLLNRLSAVKQLPAKPPDH